MAVVECRHCRGTGRKYAGFGDAPSVDCEYCSGKGLIHAYIPRKPEPVWEPFKFTPDENTRIRDAIYKHTLGRALSDMVLTRLVLEIQSIINEGTEQTS